MTIQYAGHVLCAGCGHAMAWRKDRHGAPPHLASVHDRWLECLHPECENHGRRFAPPVLIAEPIDFPEEARLTLYDEWVHALPGAILIVAIALMMIVVFVGRSNAVS